MPPAFKDAQPCLFIFDLLHFNGDNLMDKPLKERRQLLEKHVVEVANEVMHSEQYALESQTEVKALMVRVMKEGLEGLVFKDAHSTYEPGVSPFGAGGGQAQ